MLAPVAGGRQAVFLLRILLQIWQRFQAEDREAAMMTNDMRKSGIDVVGDMPWGTHFCLFYETKEDLLDTLVPYCKAGLEGQEYCLWVVAEPVREADVRHALECAVPDFDRYLANQSIEIVSARDWYLQGGTFELGRVIDGWHEKLAHASAKGYAGVRVTGDTAWLERKDWKDFCEYEEAINGAIADQHMAVLCTYPLASCTAFEILDVVRTHQFAVAKRHRSWEVIETAALKQAKAEIRRLNEELEQRVIERTSQLMLASQALQEAQAELAHVNRVTTMGQLAASIAHEVNQPITATLTNAHAALRWLDAQPPDLEEVRNSLADIIRDGSRAGDVLGRIRALVKKVRPQKDGMEINGAILEVIALTRSEVIRNGVSLTTRLAEDLPLIQGDRVQLQQVILNLIINAIEAMSGVSDGSRELLIGTERDASGGVLVAVQDSGPGLNPESFDRLFDAFHTTKPGGMGMGLPICRSIVEAHGGRVWASRTDGRGATVQFTLPVG
jgi:signal transduction histidine kinase